MIILLVCGFFSQGGEKEMAKWNKQGQDYDN